MAAADGKQSFARRDLVQAIEAEVQKKWEEQKVFEVDAPTEECDKFMCTFPYPYMNGLLHLGHAFSMTKADFAAHFNRHLGKKVLYPYGFHCTGMPIQAAANKLKREFEVYGSPFPVFPPGRPTPKADKDDIIEIDDTDVTLMWKSPSSTGKKAIKEFQVFMSVGGGEFKMVDTVPPPSAEMLAESKGKVSAKIVVESGGCVYKVVAVLEDGSKCPESKESDTVSVDAAPAGAKKAGGPPGKRVAKKILAKSGDAATQWEILKAMGIPPEEMPKFTDPMFWLYHWPPLGIRDLKRFGAPIDFRRSFITTAVNPFYDQFVRWQFRKLKAADKIGFGKRPTIFSETDGQACMDHDRAEGEGVGPQEYTAIKIEIAELPPAMKKLKGKTVYLLAATLRPETMPGQTNCWILPEGLYGCFQASGKDVYVCSHRAARNMSFQEILQPWGKPNCLLEVKGKDMIGAKIKAPTAKYPIVHLLPLLTIKMDKGTGVVTSVPSDSPDDYAAYMDLMKPGKREHLKVKAEWVEPFPLVPIIDVEIDGEVRTLAAEYMCQKLGVASQNDKVKLEEAKDVCYKLGFDKGILSNGPFKGTPVKKSKNEFRAQMIKDNQAFLYSEPEKKVVGRSGDDCVVAGIDQWYLKYGEATWRSQIENHVTSSDFCAYNDRIKDSFLDSFAWLKEWACSRSFGLGTKVPWDEQFVIESLSDSTIYMAYYTVAHFLQGGVLDGSKGSPEGIKPEDLTDDVWDFIFVDGPMPKDSKIPTQLLEKMRHEFKFWYPLDLRVSGKDLIQNHLTMFLYNHACVWEKQPEMWPKSVFCNGWLCVNNMKMSKSKGNFFTLEDIMQKYSSDAVRLACADAGDTLEDANFQESLANKALVFFPVLLETIKNIVSGTDGLQEGDDTARFVDRWFANEMNRLVAETKKHYETMYYREALRTAYHEFVSAFDKYRDICSASRCLPNKTLAMRYLEWQMIILSPICPHVCEKGWEVLGKTGSVLDARFPEPLSPIDSGIIKQGEYIFEDVPHDFIKLLEKVMAKAARPPSATAYIAKEFPPWKVSVLGVLRKHQGAGTLPLVAPEEMKQDDTAKAQWKAIMQELMQDASLKPFGKHLGPFAAYKRDEAASAGVEALSATLPFDEEALMKEHVEYLKDKLRMDVVIATSAPADPKHQDAFSTAQPGKPAIFFEAAAGDAKAPGGKAGGGDAGKPAAKAKATPAAKAATKPILDLGKLNEHLSTVSYFEGGPKPTAADVTQLAAMPAGVVDEEKFPHVARWQSHISFFTAAQRARW